MKRAAALNGGKHGGLVALPLSLFRDTADVAGI